MELAVNSLAIFVHHLESVGTVSVHVPIAVGDSPVTEQEGDLVCGLRPETEEIPEHVGILETKNHKHRSSKYA